MISALREFGGSLCELWHRDRLLFLLEVLGTTSSMIAAMLISMQLAGMLTVFVFWSVGSVSLTISSYKRNNSMMMLMMLFYTALNLMGIWNLT
jgi:hypothetical protein